jgi:predicted RNA binding protein YcfA (HicA-like mRNA interferase family)
MPKLKRLSGSDVVAILGTFGFSRVTQRGSHIKLRRVSAAGEKQTLIVPEHRELEPGTTRAIYRQACRYISSGDLSSHFFSK